MYCIDGLEYVLSSPEFLHGVFTKSMDMYHSMQDWNSIKNEVKPTSNTREQKKTKYVLTLYITQPLLHIAILRPALFFLIKCSQCIANTTRLPYHLKQIKSKYSENMLYYIYVEYCIVICSTMIGFDNTTVFQIF